MFRTSPGCHLASHTGRLAALITAALCGPTLAQPPGHESLATAAALETALVNVGDAAPAIQTTLITGRSDMLFPRTMVANLDAGNLVAGNTLWSINDDGVFYSETHVGFLWSPATGSMPFAISEDLYFNNNDHLPGDIADNGTVVGTDVFWLTFTFQPFRWTPQNGFEFLATPGPGWLAAAITISADGSVIAGNARQGPFSTDPASAVRWVNIHHAQLLDDGGALWSNAWDNSDDGSVIVGDFGPSDTQLSATRWIDGVQQTLDAIPNQTFSTAQLTSADGQIAIGYATVGGVNVLVQWGPDGAATSATPPAGMTIEVINAISDDGNAAVGAVSSAGNWAPFVWTAAGGFTIIPEAGRPDDYDISQAYDVSNDGSRVVGTLQSSVVFEGDPPQLGFVWMPEQGLALINDLLASSGFVDPDYWTATAISGDGRRLLATGNVDGTAHDTLSLLIRLSPGALDAVPVP